MATRNRTSPIERFALYVDPQPSGCWNWLGTRSEAGYAKLWIAEARRAVYAHRFSYEYHVGPIPDGLQIDHLCKNTSCVNPDHLDVVTAAENARRADSPSVVAARTNRCQNGHEFTPENTIVRRNGDRMCRTCHKAWKLLHNSKSHIPHDGSVLIECANCGKSAPLVAAGQRHCSERCCNEYKNRRGTERRRARRLAAD